MKRCVSISLRFLLCAICSANAPIVHSHEATGFSISSLLPPTDPIVFELRDPPRLLASYGEPSRAYALATSAIAESASYAAMPVLEARLLTELGLYDRAESTLSNIPPPGSPRSVSLRHLWRARLSVLAGRHERALRYLEAFDPALSSAFDRYGSLVRFEALMAAGKVEQALETGERLLAEGGLEALKPHIEETLMSAYIAADSLGKAISLAASLEKESLAPDVAARIAEREIDLLYKSGHTAQAREKTLVLAKTLPGELATLAAIQRMIQRFPLDQLTSAEMFACCERLLEENQLLESRKILSHLGKRRLNRAEVEARRILLSELHYREKRYAQAAGLSKRRYSDPSLKRRSMLILARCYRRMERPVSAARIYERFAVVFPSDPKAPEALFVASELYIRSRRIKESLKALERLNVKYPSSYFGNLSALRIAWHHSSRGRHKRSAAILQQSLRRSGKRDEAALFYLAQTYHDLGRTSEHVSHLDALRSLDSLSFYLYPSIDFSFTQPMLSSSGVVELQGERGLINFLEKVHERRRRSYQEILESLAEPRDTQRYAKASIHVERGKAFLDMGLRDWAERELAVAERILKSSKRLLFELGILHELYGMPWRSIKIYQSVWDGIHGEKRRALGRAFAELLHPLLFPAQVLENCARQGLPPHLVYAMIREESRFDLRAVSRAGAQGLMQLMPGTGMQVARELDLPQEIGEDLFEPHINLAFGIWYASFLLRRCAGDPLMMLAAYNAGLSNARRWFPKHDGDRSVPRIIDAISYKETRIYVKRIVESANAYHRLYFSPRRDSGIPKR